MNDTYSISYKTSASVIQLSTTDGIESIRLWKMALEPIELERR